MFRIVDEVVNEAYNEDKEYVMHLEETIADRVAPVDVYDFAYEIIVDDEAKVGAITLKSSEIVASRRHIL